MNIIRYPHSPLLQKIEEYDKLGGVVIFFLFDAGNGPPSYEQHRTVAQNSLAELIKDNDEYFERLAAERNTRRDRYYQIIMNPEILKRSGVKISPREFLGPYFDFDAGKPIVRGKNVLINSYFHYDAEEKPGDAIDIDERSDEFPGNVVNGMSRGFCGAFLEPPHSVRLGKTIYEHGKYFLDFCELLFSDVKNVQVYKWSTDSSNYFDDGKEWWGAHFWTVYNPARNIYTGILASATD